MRVHRDQPVDDLRHQAPEVPRGHTLAGVEPIVLPEIGEVGGDEAHPGGPEVADRPGEERDPQERITTPVQAADEHHLVAGDVSVHTDVQLAIRELSHLGEEHRDAEPGRQIAGMRFVARNGEDDGHRRDGTKIGYDDPEVGVRRVVVVGLLVAAYALAFVALHPRIGDSVLALTVVPLLVAAWLFGLRGGVIAGIGLVALDIALVQLSGAHDGFRPNQIPRILVAIGLGALVGYVRDLKLDLERRVAERTRELVENNARARELEARAAAADRMAQIGTLTAGIGHQINNPLAAVLANLDEIARRIPPGDPQLAEATRDAQEAAMRVAQIARDVRLFTHRASPAGTATNVRTAIESTVRMVTNEIRQRARLELDLTGVPYAKIATNELCQILLNLMVNAFQFLPATGTHTVSVRARASADGTTVVIEISDTGAGIPPDLRTRVFDPFFTTKPVGDGTGLGLWVCHQLVRAASGTIEIADAAPGTTVRIALPAGAPACEPVPVATAAKARILVIDDDPIVGRAVEKLVRDRHDVIVVIDPVAALRRLEAGDRFDVILSDVMMPELDGAELYGKLQTLAPEQAARMIFMSGGAFTGTTKQFFEAPERVRLDKPFTREDLDRVLARVLTVPSAGTPGAAAG